MARDFSLDPRLYSGIMPIFEFNSWTGIPIWFPIKIPIPIGFSIGFSIPIPIGVPIPIENPIPIGILPILIEILPIPSQFQ